MCSSLAVKEGLRFEFSSESQVLSLFKDRDNQVNYRLLQGSYKVQTVQSASFPSFLSVLRKKGEKMGKSRSHR